MADKTPEVEPIIELIETIPTQYIIAALVAGVVIGAILLLVVDDVMRKNNAKVEDA
jgi:hypothetical protein